MLQQGALLQRVLFLPLVCWLLTSSSVNAANSDELVAYKANQYKRLLIGYASTQWLSSDAPYALLAAQIHQESRWNPLAKSAYACGLSQFTPDTSAWISKTYSVAVGEGECTNPAWALRAHSAYMRHLEKQSYSKGQTVCDVWRFALWGYNGGPGWVIRDKALTAKAGKNPLNANDVASFNAGRKIEFFRENRTYDIGIINRWQPLYKDWGGYLYCTITR